MDHDHSSPELVDHLKPVVYLCYHAAYDIEIKEGRKWSTFPAFAEGQMPPEYGIYHRQNTE